RAREVRQAAMRPSPQLAKRPCPVASSANDRIPTIERTFGLFSCDPRENASLFMVAAGSLFNAASLKVNHAHDHCPVRVEGQILESPSAIECAQLIVDRVRDNAEAADLAGGSERRPKSEELGASGHDPFL